MKFSKSDKIVIICTILIIAYIIADCFFRDAAFKDSNDFVVHLQSDLSSYFFDVFFIIFCDILYPIVAGALLMLYYALTFQKVKTLAFILYFILITYICSIMKIFYHDPRPYWEDSSIEAKECYSEYGNPSGHSMMSILLFGMIWMRYVWSFAKYGEVGLINKITSRYHSDENDIPLMNSQGQAAENDYDTIEVFDNGLEIQETKQEKQKPEVKPDRTAVFIIISIIFLLLEFFILFGRIYLGMHSYNEVFLGFLYGLYFLIIYYQYFEKAFMKLIESIIVRHYKLELRGNLFDWKGLCVLILGYLIFLLVPIIIYEIFNDILTIPTKWIDNIQRACPNNSELKMFLNKCFVDCGVISTNFGILLGIFFTRGEYYSLKLMYSSDKNPHYIFLQEFSYKKHILRVIIVIIVCAVWAGCFAVIPNGGSVYACYFVNNNLATFLSSFFLIKLVPFINKKFDLEYEKDFLKYNNGDLVVHSHTSIPYEEVKN